MKPAVLALGLAGACACAAPGGTERPAEPDEPALEVPLGRPPARAYEWHDEPLWWRTVRGPEGHECRVRFGRTDRALRLEWVLREEGGAPRRLTGSQPELPYWPTRVMSFDEGLLLVGGRYENGDTVVELWELEFPVAETHSDSISRTTSTRWRGGSARPLLELYRDARVGRDVVSALARCFGTPAAVLVRFQDSGAIERIEFEELLRTRGERGRARMERVASASAEHGQALHVGELAHWPNDSLFGFVHAREGYVYVLSIEGGEQGMLALYDRDRDGRLDGSSVLDFDAFEQLIADEGAVLAPEF